MKLEHEVLIAQQVIAKHEIDAHHAGVLSKEQKAYLMGMRCSLAWVLGLPKGGRKLEEMMRGVPLNAIVGPAPAEDFNRGLILPGEQG